jgi:F420-non-reducing hydrogenase iron-sulfur subunit
MIANPKVSDSQAEGVWQPTIAAFFCNWCTYTAADLAGVSRLKYAPNVRVIRLMCSGRVDPQFILEAFAKGADGVLIGGCHPGDCHYAEGNYKALRRFEMLKRMTAQMGIEPQRLRLEWISASEGDKVRTVINEMVEQVRALGPLEFVGHAPKNKSGAGTSLSKQESATTHDGSQPAGTTGADGSRQHSSSPVPAAACCECGSTPKG